MVLARSKGWIRLGIVLSVAWIVGVLIYAVWDQHSFRSEFVASENSEPPVVFSWEAAIGQSFLTDCSVKEKIVSCLPRFANLALLTLLPVVGSWLIVLLIVYVVLWVRAGFRGDDKS